MYIYINNNYPSYNKGIQHFDPYDPGSNPGRGGWAGSQGAQDEINGLSKRTPFTRATGLVGSVRPEKWAEQAHGGIRHEPTHQPIWWDLHQPKSLARWHLSNPCSLSNKRMHDNGRALATHGSPPTTCLHGPN